MSQTDAGGALQKMTAFITRLIAGKRLAKAQARIRALEAELTAAQQRERRALASLGGRRWHPSQPRTS